MVVNRSKMIWAVTWDGRLCVRHAEENVLCVVGIRAIKSYALKKRNARIDLAQTEHKFKSNKRN